MSFLNSVLNQSKKYEEPFQHWELNQPLTEEQIKEIVKADIDNPSEHNLNYDGTRAIDGGEGDFREGISDGGKALKFRCFITKENFNEFPALTNLIKDTNSKANSLGIYVGSSSYVMVFNHSSTVFLVSIGVNNRISSFWNLLSFIS